MTATSVRQDLRALADPDIAKHSARFFRTEPGGYGEGDKFLGIRIPKIRALVREYRSLPERSLLSVLKSDYHEERMFAVLLLVDQYKRSDADGKQRLCDLYLDYRRYVNNWDLVDSSAHLVLGPQLQHTHRNLLYELAESDILWDRRIAMMATYHYIRQGDFKDTLQLAELLLQDPEDLMHKSVGWMLREVGNRDRKTEEAFLRKYYRTMPRTMLRYAIEKFPERLRKAYLRGKV